MRSSVGDAVPKSSHWGISGGKDENNRVRGNRSSAGDNSSNAGGFDLDVNGVRIRFGSSVKRVVLEEGSSEGNVVLDLEVEVQRFDIGRVNSEKGNLKGNISDSVHVSDDGDIAGLVRSDVVVRSGVDNGVELVQRLIESGNLGTGVKVVRGNEGSTGRTSIVDVDRPGVLSGVRDGSEGKVVNIGSLSLSFPKSNFVQKSNKVLSISVIRIVVGVFSKGNRFVREDDSRISRSNPSTNSLFTSDDSSVPIINVKRSSLRERRGNILILN